MRLLLVSHGLPPEATAGVELATLHLAHALRARGHSVASFCREGDPRAPEFRRRFTDQAGLPVWRVNHNFVDAADYAAYYRRPEPEAHFRRVLAEWQPDLVHFQHCLGLSAGLPELTRAAGVPAVLTLHDYWYLCPTVQLRNVRGEACPGTHHPVNCFECLRFVDPRLGRLRRTALYRLVRASAPAAWRQGLAAREAASLAGIGGPPPAPQPPTAAQRGQIEARTEFMRRALSAPQALTAPSRYLKDVYTAFGVPDDRLRVVPLGMDLDRWRGLKRRPGTPGVLRALFLGGRLAHKGVLLALDAFRALPGPAHRLRLAGPAGHEPVVLAQTDERLAADPRVTWLGQVPQAQLPALLAASDALLAPTLWPETFSFVVREALLAGVWVLAADLGVMRELIQPGRNGELLPLGDAPAWTAALERAAARPANAPAPSLSFAPLTHAEYAAEMETLYRAAGAPA
jgi:glycosyltransferase involved in cell wall biosynthesis